MNLVLFETFLGCEQSVGGIQPLPSALQPKICPSSGLGSWSFDRKRVPYHKEQPEPEHQHLEGHNQHCTPMKPVATCQWDCSTKKKQFCQKKSGDIHQWCHTSFYFIWGEFHKLCNANLDYIWSLHSTKPQYSYALGVNTKVNPLPSVLFMWSPQ